MLAKGSTAIDGTRAGCLASAAARRPALGVRLSKTHAKDADRPADVLDALLAEILEVDVEPVADLIAHRRGDADAARLGQRLEPRRDVHAVAEDVVVLDDDVAEIDADAELDGCAPPGHRRCGAPCGAGSPRRMRPRR